MKRFRHSRLTAHKTLPLLALLCGLAGWARADTTALDVAVIVQPLTLTQDATEIERSFRASEAQVMAVLVKETLERSGHWGAVRVFEEASPLAHLMCRITLEQSDGEQLALRVRVESVAGQLVLDRSYSYTTKEADYIDFDRDPYQPILDVVALDISEVIALSSIAASDLSSVSELRYAMTLTDAFTPYLEQGGNGQWRLLRLPLAEDPMLRRINRLRDYELLFIDAIDDQRSDQRDRLLASYSLWRQSSREQLQWLRGRSESLAARQENKRQSEFVRLNSAYATYRAYKLHQQELYELVVELESESRSTVVEVDEAVYRLSGTLDAQAKEWRSTLATIFALENPE